MYFELRETKPNVQIVPFSDIMKTQSRSLCNLLHIKHLTRNIEWQVEDKACRQMDSFSFPLPVTSHCQVKFWPQIRAQVREGLWFLACHQAAGIQDEECSAWVLMLPLSTHSCALF